MSAPFTAAVNARPFHRGEAAPSPESAPGPAPRSRRLSVRSDSDIVSYGFAVFRSYYTGLWPGPRLGRTWGAL
jgi:hypothetical protein